MSAPRANRIATRPVDDVDSRRAMTGTATSQERLQPPRARHEAGAPLSRTGHRVQVRPLHAQDREELQQLLNRTSARSLYQRFFSTSQVTAGQYLDILADPNRTVDGVVAISHGRIVAVGSTHQTRARTGVEVALLIDDAHQNTGLGTLLIEDLAARTKERGVTTMTALVLSMNGQIRRLLDDLGLPVHYDCDGQTSTATIDLVHGQLPNATARRHWHAAARSLDPFVHPGTILVVGSPSRSVPAFRDVLSHLRATNPRPAVSTARLRHDPVRGPWLSARRAIPDGVDLAILAVRSNELRDAVDCCVRAGARAILAMAPGEGPARFSLDAELAAVCAAAGVRLLGPGSSGLVSTDPDGRLDASTWPLSVRAGEVCLVAGSRRQAVTVAGLLDVMDVGLSTVFMLGDAVDVNAADVLAFAGEDPRTRVAVVALDGPAVDRLRNVRVGTGLAVVAFLPPGGTPPPHHSPPPPGIIVTRTWMELADTVVLLLCQRRPAGPQAAVITTTAGASREASYALEDAGLLTATVTQHTEMRTRMLLPTAAHTGGSVTAPAGTDPATFGLVLRTLADDPGVDAIICAVDPVRSASARLAETLDSVSRDYPDVTLVSAVPLTTTEGGPRLGRVPCLPDLHRAACALAKVRQPRHPLPVPADPGNA